MLGSVLGQSNFVRCRQVGLFQLFNMGEDGDTQFPRFALATFVCGRDDLRLVAAAATVVR